MKRPTLNTLGNLVLFLSSLAISAWVAEFAWRQLRSLDYGPATNPEYVIYDEILGWKYRPNALHRHKTQQFDVEILIDSAGRRTSPSCSPEPGRESLKIAFLGDSFTFGWGVEAVESFPCLMQKALQANIMNFGVAGYGTDQEFLVFRQEVLASEPDVVILTYSRNDLREVVSGRRYGHPKPKIQWGEKGVFHISPADERANILDRYSSLYRSLRFYSGRFLGSDQAASRTSEGTALIKQLIDEMARASQAAGIRFLLVAEGANWLKEAYSSNPININYIDVKPALMDAARDHGSVKIPHDGHWNRRGHRVVTTEILDNL